MLKSQKQNFDISRFSSIHSIISVNGNGPYLLRLARYLQSLFTEYNSVNSLAKKSISSAYLVRAKFARFSAKWAVMTEGLVVDELEKLLAVEDEDHKQKTFSRR